jgi:hypothetical protein
MPKAKKTVDIISSAAALPNRALRRIDKLKMPKVSRREFEQLPLRVHKVLAGTPLHDVWAVDLRHWRSGIALCSFLEAAPLDSIPTSPLARYLMRLRFSIGWVMGWDRTAKPKFGQQRLRSGDENEPTFVVGMSADDRMQSRIRPGTRAKRMRIVYSFANEHLLEVKNRTVHAAMAVVLVERPESYRLYLGVFVHNVNRWTPYYMAAIAPFRRWIIYPSLLRGIRKKWDELFGLSASTTRETFDT